MAVRKVVYRAHDRTVSQLFSQFRNRAIEFIFVHFTEDFLPEGLRNGLHLGRNCRIISRKISMICSGVYYAERISRRCEVKVHRMILRVFLILKIYRYYASECTSHLVEQAGRFSEIHVLSVLTDLGDLSKSYAV